MDHRYCGSKGAMVVEMGKRERSHTGECTRRTFPQSHWLEIQEGLHFLSSWNQHGLKPGVWKVSELAWGRARRAWATPREKADKPRVRQHRNSNLKNAWGTQGGRLVAILEMFPGRQHSWKFLLGTKGTGWCRFPPLLLSINTEPLEETSSAHIELDRHWLPNLLTPGPTSLCSDGTALLSQACLSPTAMGLFPINPYLHHVSSREFCRSSVQVELVSGLISQADQNTPS